MQRKRQLIASVVAFAALSTFVAVTNTAFAAPTTAVTVDFTNTIAQTPASNIGFTATTFGVEGGPVTRSGADIASLKALGAGAVRIHLKPSGNGVISGAGGGDASVSGQAWLDTYKEIGVTPTVIVNLDVNDATAVLRYLMANNYNVNRFIVGNEMDENSKADVSQDEYTTKFHRIAAAMRAIKPGVEVGGPGVACWDCFNEQWVKNLMDAPANERPSFIDYHAYGAGNGQNATMASSVTYNDQLPKLRQWIGDDSVGVQIGEFNMNWGDESQNNTQTQTVWMANALGSILANGGVAFQYGDKNNAMGLTSNYGAPKASYWGMGMFTGASKFRHFGTSMVAATSSDNAVKVYASNNAKNVVVVNSGGATQANIKLNGYANGTARVWQSTNINVVDKGVSAVSGGSLVGDLPGNSVTTFVLDADTGSPATTVPPVTNTTVKASTSSTSAVPTAPTITAKPTTSVAPTTLRPTISTTTVVPPTPSTTSGIRGEYFNNPHLLGTPALTRTDHTINFNWGTNAPANGLNPDNFSVRWTAKLKAPKSEIYIFRTSSDDGVRLWINGNLIVDNWTSHSWTDNTAQVKLEAGNTYNIKMEYYDSGNTAVAILRWSSPSIPLVIIPANAFVASEVSAPEARGNGLNAQFFNNKNLSGSPVVTRNDPAINFNWDTAAPAAGVSADNFSARWTGTLTAPKSETYTLRTSSDDGIRVWISGKLVIDNWTNHSWTDDSAAVKFEAGQAYDIKVEYYDAGLSALAILRWSSPSTSLSVVPASAFS